MAAYEAVPTDEQNPQTQSTTTGKPSGRKLSSLRTPFIVLAALCLTTLAVYKAGQWSAERGHSATALESVSNSTTVEDNESDISVPVLNNTVEMPGNGKYSVG